MTEYLDDFIEQELILDKLSEKSSEEQLKILNSIQPNNFEDMIYVSEFYLSRPQYRKLFLDKISQITIWKTYFDQQPRQEFIQVFFQNAEMNLVDLELVNYYISHFKMPLPVFKQNFRKIYQMILANNEYDRNKLLNDSLQFDRIFALQGKYELIEIFDYLLRNINESKSDKEKQEYSDVLMILLSFIKTAQIELPKNRLDKLYKLL
jgi:hypothetical protein